MSLIGKARQILRTHGAYGLFQRARSKVGRTLRARNNARMQQRAWEALLSRAKTGPVFFPRHTDPLVSIIIPVYNNVHLTAMCLNAVLRELDSRPCEVIVVDDGSTDGTPEYLEACSGIRVIRHEQNQGFVHSANDGADAARGRYLHFLNNDAIVTPNWMTPLLLTFETRDRVGAAGSQLRSPDGKVSEAGAIIWRDGSGTNYGRGISASEPGVAFPRDADYCSAASLMVRTELFADLGGFSREFVPGYYEDADLCFRVRAAGYRVVYQPESVVLHFEGATAGAAASGGMKRFQDVHRNTFAAKWHARLAKHYPPDEDLIERAARRINGTRTALVMDSFIPFEDRSAGARRILQIMRLMRELGWHVIFVSDDGGAYEPYTSRLRRAGVEVLPHRGNAAAVIRSLPVPIDLAWVCRPDVLQKHLRLLRAATSATVVYDTVDLHFLRQQREEEVIGVQTHWEAMRTVELDLARRVEHTVVTSALEARLLQEEGIETSIVPIIETPIHTFPSYAARRDILFLANYTHEPNVDAATWLATEIMPLLWERMPDLRLILAGADPTPAITRLGGERIVVTGHIPEIRSEFARARVFAAPIRYGAGMKGKIVQSIAYGVPVVTTDIGAEGIGLTDGESALMRNDAQGFAQAVLELYNSEMVWNAIAGQAMKVAQQFSAENVKLLLEQALERALQRQIVNVGIDVTHSAHSA